MVKYLFRKPRFPVICSIDGRLLAATSDQVLRKQLAAIELREGSNYPLVDSSAEGWSLVADYMVVSPLTIDNEPEGEPEGVKPTLLTDLMVYDIHPSFLLLSAA